MAHHDTDGAQDERNHDDTGTGDFGHLGTDDDVVAFVGALINAHGHVFTDELRDLVAGDPDAVRRAVVRHHGSALRGLTRAELARRADLPRGDRLRAGAVPSLGNPHRAAAAPLTWEGDCA